MLGFIEENVMREVSPNCVLLVDDDPDLREVLSARLESEGFKARQAQDGIDGLVKLRDELPKVIISDLRMPRMSGIEFITVVRRRFPGIPTIVLSGAIPDEVPAEAQPDVWFDKGGLNISELLRALHDLVRRSPDRANLPPVATPPARPHPDVAGYFMLTCPDCLRTFKATSVRENQEKEETVVCIYCGARVRFVIESPTQLATMAQSVRSLAKLVKPLISRVASR
jgi:DNA-binding response OmpR family regulator